LRKAKEWTLSEFGSLNGGQLNWKSDPENWSIAQCLEHIVVVDTLYFPVFEKISEGSYDMSFWEKWSPFSTGFGRMLVNQMNEKVTRKFRSPRSFRPDTRPIGPEVITRFSKHQDTLIQFVEKLDTGHAEKIRITSPASRLVTYSLADALQMLVQHQYRHLNQALRVKNSNGFPG